MYAVLRIDLEPRPISFLDDFIHTGRATLGRLCVHGQVISNRHVSVFQRQVTGLIFFVIGIGQKHR